MYTSLPDCTWWTLDLYNYGLQFDWGILFASFPGQPHFHTRMRKSAFVYYFQCKPRNRKRGRPGNEASILSHSVMKI